MPCLRSSRITREDTVSPDSGNRAETSSSLLPEKSTQIWVYKHPYIVYTMSSSTAFIHEQSMNEWLRPVIIGQGRAWT